MADQFKNVVDKSGPYTGAVAVTPHDSTNLAQVTRALFFNCDDAETLNCLMPDGTTMALTFHATGHVLLPVRVVRVNNTGTNVTNIVALY